MINFKKASFLTYLFQTNIDCWSFEPDTNHNALCRFTNDIYEMTGYRPGIYWQVTWRYVGPVIVTCILLSSLVFMLINPPTYGAWNADEVRDLIVQTMLFLLLIITYLVHVYLLLADYPVVFAVRRTAEHGVHG